MNLLLLEQKVAMVEMLKCAPSFGRSFECVDEFQNKRSGPDAYCCLPV